MIKDPMSVDNEAFMAIINHNIFYWLALAVGRDDIKGKLALDLATELAGLRRYLAETFDAITCTCGMDTVDDPKVHYRVQYEFSGMPETLMYYLPKPWSWKNAGSATRTRDLQISHFSVNAFASVSEEKGCYESDALTN